MSQLDAKTLLSDAGSAYARLTSYQDEGEVIVTPKDKEPRKSVTFETQFSRPSLFRFRFTSPHPYPPLSHVVTTTICGQDETSAFMWLKHHDDAPRIEQSDDLMMAVAGATGISSGSAHTIWQMLFRGASDWLNSLDSLSILGEASVEGIPCTVLRGSMADTDVSMRLFIDLRAMVLRKVAMEFESFSSEETRRNIRVNEKIEAAVFARPKGEI